MGGEIVFCAQAGGGLDGVLEADGEQPFVKGPVTEAAEGHAVAGVVVVADAPGDYVGGGNGRVLSPIHNSWIYISLEKIYVMQLFEFSSLHR